MSARGPRKQQERALLLLTKCASLAAVAIVRSTQVYLMPCSQVYSYLSVLHVLKCTYQYVLYSQYSHMYREYTRVGTGFRGSSEF